ncbi:unnamed protein product [Cuscuta campestris]|uniref:Uncharacterized protein n=1 Tax=Cuscuta campestris TaxID=132261 RepID=A0A484KE01_9ASTE|nr:unnamed protein product [Cuscuta campestris]
MPKFKKRYPSLKSYTKQQRQNLAPLRIGYNECHALCIINMNLYHSFLTVCIPRLIHARRLMCYFSKQIRST